MENQFLYQRIAEEIQENILNGCYQPDERLPTIRALTKRWNCTPGTVQHAYKILNQQGLVISQPGRGTRVAGHAGKNHKALLSWRQAKMFHQAETFLLDSLLAGYSFEEIQTSIDHAKNHLQVMQNASS